MKVTKDASGAKSPQGMGDRMARLMDEDLVGRYSRLLAALDEKTRAGVLTWWQSENDKNKFFAATERIKLSIESVKSDGSSPYRLRIGDERFPIESIESGLIIDPDARTTIERMLDSLYWVVRRHTLKIDEKIDELFQDLGVEENYY
jgi:hypothetical protein